MNPKILRTNLLILLGMAVLAVSLGKVTAGASVIFFGMGMLAQAASNGVLGVVLLIGGKNDWGAYLLSAVLVLLIGFGACAGMLALDLVKLNI